MTRLKMHMIENLTAFLDNVHNKGLQSYQFEEQSDILKHLYTRSSQVAFSSLDEILLPYLQHDDVNSKLKMLAKEILLTWVTRHVVYASLEIKRIDKIFKIINESETSSKSLPNSINFYKKDNNNDDTRTIVNNVNDTISNDIMYSYNNSCITKKRKYIDTNDDSMIKKVLEDIIMFNSLKSANDTSTTHSIDPSLHDNSSQANNDVTANSKYEELILSCRTCHLQISKFKLSGSSASGKLKSMVTTIANVIDEVCHIDSNSKKLEALYILGLWQADDDILVQIADYYQNNDHVRTIVFVVFVGMLLLKARSIRVPATRTFLRAIELIVKCRTEIAIAGLLSRIIRVPNLNSTNDCPVAIMRRLIGSDSNTIPGSFQFEFFQRSARQILSKQQKDRLLFHSFTANDTLVDIDFLKLLDGVLSPLAILKAKDPNVNTDTIFEEWKRLIKNSSLTSIALPISPILWDNDNLKILNSVLTGCPEISVIAVRLILINLDDIAVGNVSICSSINLAAVLHTIVTKCITIITNNDLSNLARGLLTRCSNPMAKNAISILNKGIK